MTMNAADLQKFCEPQDGLRFSLQHPYSLGQSTYATNGHIIVCVPRLDDVPENDKAPNPERLFATAKSGEWLPVPVCAMPALVPCKWCYGTGKDPVDKRYKCEECDGKKLVPDARSHVIVGGLPFAQRYLALIQGWEIAPTGTGSAARIRNGEAEGLLMPMRI